MIDRGIAQQPVAPRRRMSRAQRERQILDVAEAVFAERGYHGTSMEEIGDRVGVSKPLLYEYFGSKDGLLRACIDRVRAELYEVTTKAMENAAEPGDLMWRGLVAYFEFAAAHERAFAVLLSETPVLGSALADIEGIRRQQIGVILDQLAAFMPDVDTGSLEPYAQMLVGACERLACWRTAHPAVTPEECARHVMNFAWYGLQSISKRG